MARQANNTDAIKLEVWLRKGKQVMLFLEGPLTPDEIERLYAGLFRIMRQTDAMRESHQEHADA